MTVGLACSCNLYVTPFLSFPSQLTLVKFIKLKRTQSVCTEKERKREREREEKQRENNFFSLFFEKKEFPPKK
jgi:hypothetical protein